MCVDDLSVENVSPATLTTARFLREQELYIHLPAEGETLTVNGMVVRVLRPGVQAGGASSLLECRVPPHFAGPPLHAHRNTLESIYVLSGTLSVCLAAGRQPASISARESRHAPAGTYLALPPGVWHTFANREPVPVTFLVWLTPGREGVDLRPAGKPPVCQQPWAGDEPLDTFSCPDVVFPPGTECGDRILF